MAIDEVLCLRIGRTKRENAHQRPPRAKTLLTASRPAGPDARPAMNDIVGEIVRCRSVRPFRGKRPG